MPRKKRIWYENAQFHITARGNHRNDIFRDEIDYEVYLKGLEEAIEYYDGKFQVISYCLMTNHVHLQIQTSDIKIGELIKRINSLYAQKFNEKYNYVGHLFQGRYGSEVIENDAYALEVSRYIHLNPVRAKMVIKPEEYRWSSYSMYIGLKENKIIKSKKILSYFNTMKAQELYRIFVESAIKIKLGDEEEVV